ncbi:MAG: hypothetical protein MUF59_07290 [Candidatus Krumholzibacteria bacterium]|nr:hypothetical protein [Candidatus Krumholzibacteria bacterium]
MKISWKYPCIMWILAALTFQGCGDDPDVMRMPIIVEVSPDTAGVGDTLTIYGSGLLSDQAQIEAAFSACGFTNRYSYRVAVPFDVTSSRMSVIVPDGAFSGQLRLQWPNPVSSSGMLGLSAPPVSSDPAGIGVIQDPGDAAKIFFSASDYEFTLGSDDEATVYLLILFNSAAPSPSGFFEYDLASGSPCCLPGGTGGYDAAPGPGGPSVEGSREPGAADQGSPTRAETDSRRKATRAFDFEKRKREEFSGLLDFGPRSAPSGRVAGAQRAAADTAVFDVYADIEGSTIEPSSFVKVTADLKYEGDHVLLYVDRETDGSCISDAEAEILGESFDSGIYSIDREAFGSESDINGDGRVSILLSPVINRLTDPGTATTEGYIGGFFLPGDLLPAWLDPSCTNGMEIFYTFVPDPLGLYGNVYEKDRALEVIRGVLAHEFLHMIMFNYRILILGEGISAQYAAGTWIEEGLAHIAEDLNDHDESNIARAALFLEDPGVVTLIHGGDALDERGAAFLFFRYLGDRFGESIFREMVRAKASGVKIVELTAGVNLFELFADWAAALYLDGTGISADPRFSYSSIDLRGDFAPLGILSAEGCMSSVSGAVKSMGPEYILLEFDEGCRSDFYLESGINSLMNAVIVRLE